MSGNGLARPQLAERIASAPISFGVFGSIRLPLTPVALLETMSSIGYRGSELGPPGFFGPRDRLDESFRTAELSAVGAYVPLHLAEPEEVFAADLLGLRSSLAELKECGTPGALAILADEGDPGLIAHPFRGAEPRLNDEQWRLAAARLTAAADLARGEGIEVSFHPHFATYVEKASEIERLLETTELSLCLDTGHVLLGGADPLDYVRRFANRINHVHLKDVILSVFESARAAGERADGPWWNLLACRLGEGDVDLLGVVGELRRTGYSGWLVVEQDREPVTEEDLPEARADQEHNFRWLSAALTSGEGEQTFSDAGFRAT